MAPAWALPRNDSWPQELADGARRKRRLRKLEGCPMGTDQYHEPADELSQETRTFARMITALIEEAEAIGWYEQRLSLEKDKDARAIMENAQKEEFKHFSMDLEFLLRHKADWRKILKGVVLVDGDIVKNAEKAEKAAD
jgi:hypothetical protein